MTTEGDSPLEPGLPRRAPPARRIAPRAVTRGAGAAALATLAALLVLRRPGLEAAGAPPARAASPPRAGWPAGEAARALGSLTTAAATLVAARAALAGPPPAPPPPRPEDFESVPACVGSYLPGVLLPATALGGFCETRDLWTAADALHRELAFRRGDGARVVARLGRESLIGAAVLRAGCCHDGAGFTAVVPTLACGVLREPLARLGAAPSDQAVADARAVLRCLESRGAHLPPAWVAAPREVGERALDRLVEAARRRGRPKGAPSAGQAPGPPL